MEIMVMLLYYSTGKLDRRVGQPSSSNVEPGIVVRGWRYRSPPLVQKVMPLVQVYIGGIPRPMIFIRVGEGYRFDSFHQASLLFFENIEVLIRENRMEVLGHKSLSSGETLKRLKRPVQRCLMRLVLNRETG